MTETEKVRASVISFTAAGGQTAGRVAEAMRSMPQPRNVDLYALPKYAGLNGATPVTEGLKTWCGSHWDTADLLVFVGASGIAVRTIAPYVKSKVTDPAVLVVDEKGTFVISLLSGHIGGANEEARALAESLGAVPVITTATDVEGRFAVDEWAEKNRLMISSMKLAKSVAADILAGRRIPIFLEENVESEGKIPPELIPMTAEEFGRTDDGVKIAVTNRSHGWSRDCVLFLIPKDVTLGIGCRKDIEVAAIENAVDSMLTRTGIFRESILQAASIDLKKDELGLLTYCRARGIPILFYSAKSLREVPGTFTSSGFVNKITGVDNVCERAAALAGGNLICRKQAGGGVTVAAAERKDKVRFWER